MGIGGGTRERPDVYVLETLAANGGDLDDIVAWVAHDGTPASGEDQFTVTAFAVCADPLPGQQEVFAYNPFSHSDQTARIECPAGTQVYSGGFQTSFGGGEIHLDRLGFHGPNRLGGVDVDAKVEPGVDVDAKVEPGGDGEVEDGWRLGVFAICAA